MMVKRLATTRWAGPYAQQFNLYAYVDNDPMNGREPSPTLMTRAAGW